MTWRYDAKALTTLLEVAGYDIDAADAELPTADGAGAGGAEAVTAEAPADPPSWARRANRSTEC
jgi:hypothetical protein